MSDKPAKGRRESIFKKSDIATVAIILIAFVALMVVIELIQGQFKFFTVANWLNILMQNAVVGIMAMGMMLIITTGNIDVSVGAQYAVAGMVVALVARTTGGEKPLLAILAGMGTGMVLGLTNGLIVAKLGIPAIVVTLGTLNIMRGTLNLITSGNWIDGLTGPFSKFANLRLLKPVNAFGPIHALTGGKGLTLFALPLAVYIWIIVMILTYIFLYRSGVGRDILAVGGNKEAAKRMGLSQTKAYLLAFGYMGMLAGLASAVAASKIKIAQPSNGTGYEMKLIAACVIGGTEFSGGVASILGTLLGVIDNGLVLTKVPAYWQELATGVIIILAVASSVFRSMGGTTRKARNGGEKK